MHCWIISQRFQLHDADSWSKKPLPTETRLLIIRPCVCPEKYFGPNYKIDIQCLIWHFSCKLVDMRALDILFTEIMVWLLINSKNAKLGTFTPTIVCSFALPWEHSLMFCMFISVAAQLYQQCRQYGESGWETGIKQCPSTQTAQLYVWNESGARKTGSVHW